MTMGNVKRNARCCAVATAAMLLAAAASANAQTFNNGSTGADGALDLTGVASGTTVEFDPVARNIDPEKDNIFNFTTITIPAGVTLHLGIKKMPNSPVYFLATGAVNIAGTLDLSGQAGYAYTSTRANRIPSLPGPGGFAGGIGGCNNSDSLGPAQNGLGPSGGLGAGNPGWGSESGSTYFLFGNAAGATGTKFLVPLVGGAGGGGGLSSSYETWGAGGGAGGGAILIASNTSIAIESTGSIVANGGNGGKLPGNCSSWGGSGGGGAVRLAAPTIGGSGVINVGGGDYCYSGNNAGASGRVRIETFNNSALSIAVYGGSSSLGSPLSAYVPASITPPALTVASVAGKPILNPTGSFSPADVTINTGGPIAIQIHASGIPVGTVTNIVLFSLEGPDQSIDSTPLAGTLQDSTATATVTLPAGFTRGYARAKW